MAKKGHKSASGYDTLAAERLRTILQAEPECVKSVDNQCRLVEMNPAGLRMIEAGSLDQVKGADLLNLVEPEFYEQYLKGVERVFAGETVKQRFRMRGLHGTLRWMEQIAAPIHADNGSGEVVEMLAVTRDVTEHVDMELDLRNALEAAKESSRAKSRFLANTSHEIRTPLNGIIGGIQILKTMNLPHAALEFIDIIGDSADTLLDILNDILDFSKLGAAGAALNIRMDSIQDTIEGAAALFRPMAIEKPLEFETEIDLPYPLVETDHARTRQILNNFLSNAIKFTPDGKITVSVTQKPLDEGVVETMFEVSDTGIGIPAEMLQTIFEPFVQVDQTHSRHYNGTGLGLAICRELALRLGGDCGVASKPGEGSTFWFYLRSRAEAAAPPARSARRA